MLAPYQNKSLFRITLHIFIWILLFLFPFFLSQGEKAIDYSRLIKFTWIPMVFYAIIFYTNYFVLIEKYLFTKKTLVFIVFNLVLIVVFTWLNFEVKDLLNMVSEVKPSLPHDSNLPGHQTQPPKDGPPLQFFVYKHALSMIIPMIIAFAVKTNEKWAKTETEKRDREKELLHSELQHLKYQLQPHFFFNSLNTIYALIERSPSQAQETVHSLAKLMRYLLYDTESGKASLKDEIDFMTQYIDLMKLRLSDKTIINTNFPALSEHLEITPLLFISLIENAFKHGVSASQRSELFFSLSVDGKTVRFFAENSNFPKNEKDKSGSGIGLVNLRKQLDIAYPNHYKFDTKVEGNLFSVLLEITIA